MKYIKKAIPLCLLALVLVLTVTLLTPKAQAATVASGTCGENLTWTLDDAGTLTISGTGRMSDFYKKGSPWYEHRASITAVVMESGATTIGHYAFQGCEKMLDVAIADTVTTIGQYAFQGCHGLVGVTIPDSVTTLEKGAFNFNNGLLSVDFGSGVTAIGVSAFDSCTSLKRIVIPEGVPAIERATFQSCYALESLTIPDSVTSIGDYAFNFCPLAYVTIPSSVTSIGENAFSYNRALKELTLPDSITTIGNSAFSGCSLLSDVYYDGSREQWHSIAIGTDNEPLLSAALHFGKEDVPEDVFVTGDMTGDGQVTNDDVVLLLWHTLFPEEYDIPYSCDLTGDGQITNADVVLLLWHTLFPEEYPLDQPSEITGVWTALQVVGNRLYEIELDLVRNILMCGYGDDIDTLDQPFREDLLKEYESGVQCLHLVNGTYYYVGMGDGGSITYTTEGNTIYVNCDNYLYLTIVKNTDDTMTIVKSDLMGEPSGILLTRRDY